MLHFIVNDFHLFDVLKVPRNWSQGLDNPCDDNRGTSHAIIKQKLFCTKGTTVAPLNLKGKSLNINISGHGRLVGFQGLPLTPLLSSNTLTAFTWSVKSCSLDTPPSPIIPPLFNAYILGEVLPIMALIIQQIVTLSKYGHDALDICHP